MDDAFALLRLQIEWGADEALSPDPLDRLRPIEATATPALNRSAAHPARRPSVPSGAAPQPVGAPAARALAASMGAQTLAALRDAVAGFDGCALRDTASNLVWAEGDPASMTLIVGEAPGRDEDRSGHPYAGEEGELLDRMLASIRLTRAQVMLAPLLPWRPPGGRPPNASELAICLPFLHRLIALQAPRFMLLMGNTAARALLPPAAARRRAEPDWIDCSIPGMHKPVASLVLPSVGDVLRSRPLGKITWAGLRRLRDVLGGP